MLTKYLLGKPTRMWDLYLDQALFACRVRTHATTETSPYYLVYGKHPRLIGDDNYALDINAPTADPHSRIEAVQSARQQASRVTYERALREKTLRDEKAQLHRLDVGQWVLVRHETPPKVRIQMVRTLSGSRKNDVGYVQIAGSKWKGISNLGAWKSAH